MQQNHLTLSELNRQIKDATESSFPEALWVIAEIMEIQVNRSGHCYMELIEKSDSDTSVVAKSRATIWSFKYRMLRPYFESTTGSSLKQGIKVLVKAEVSFHEVYGLSLNITDIDPSYTMGDIALRRKEVLSRLEAAGVLKMNKELPLSEVPQRIAVISSETAAGLGDFMDSIVQNSYGYSFRITLYPAIMQGEAAEYSIISALEKVYENEEAHDAVVIIRGGGSQSDLDCFNTFDLALNIAQFPLPVLTGIGHERDETIIDIVANRSLKTPTAVAAFLIEKVFLFADKLDRMEERFGHMVRAIIQEETLGLKQKASELNYLVKGFISEERRYFKSSMENLSGYAEQRLMLEQNFVRERAKRLKYLWKGLYENRKKEIGFLDREFSKIAKNAITGAKEQFSRYEKSLELISPENVLARGYSISYVNGQALKTVDLLQKGMKVTTKLARGSFESEIENIEEP